MSPSLFCSAPHYDLKATYIAEYPTLRQYFLLNFTANSAIGQGKSVQKPRNFGNNVWNNRQFCQKHYNLIVYRQIDRQTKGINTWQEKD